MRVRDMRLGFLAVLYVLLLGTGQARAVTLALEPSGPLAVNQEYYAVRSPGIVGEFEDFIPVMLSGPMTIKTTLTPNVPPPGSFSSIFFEWTDDTPPIATGLGTDLVRTFTVGAPYILRVFGTASGIASYTATLTTTPLPPALILFGTALAGLTWLGRRRRSSNPAAQA